MSKPVERDNQTAINSYRLWVSEDSTVLVRLWDDGTCETAARDHRSHTWGPPTYLSEEVVKP